MALKFSEALAEVLDELDAAGFENQTTLAALIGTVVTDVSGYASLRKMRLANPCSGF
ncbi:MAG: hypothetical protein IJL92_06720 [Thermoguttaceae bacterium]|nr:hypothetical protein [Thermoguttaceae bacterium]